MDGWFREIYPKLVGGGQARLQLTDEEDMLDTGVDIFVQPPGKRLQNLSLLSGGETAMVAIALIFSLFRVKPSPFCLLDEVDAPLDEGNGARFNSMLRDMAALSQFILVTHNKKTMECADTLYGDHANGGRRLVGSPRRVMRVAGPSACGSIRRRSLREMCHGHPDPRDAAFPS